MTPADPPTGYRPTVAALSAGQILCWAVLYYAFTAFVLPMQRDLGWSAQTLMGAYTTGLAVCAACSFAVGSAIDRGHGRAMLAIGPLVGAAGVALWAGAHSVPGLYAAWVVIGVAMAMTLYEPAFTVVTRLYPMRFKQAVTAITLVGGFASTLCFPVVALLQATLPWRQALLVLAASLLVAAALHARVLRGASIAAAPPSAAPLAPDATLGEAFRSRAFWALTATFAGYSFVASAMWAHMAPALADKGLSDADALMVLVCVGPAQVVGRLVFVLLGRRVALRRLGLVTLVGMPLGLVLFALGRSLAALLLFALLFGMANGVSTLVRGGLLPDYFGRAALGRIGGSMSGVAQFARAAAPLLAAGVLLLVPGYREMVLVAAALAALAWAAFALAGRPSRELRR